MIATNSLETSERIENFFFFLEKRFSNRIENLNGIFENGKKRGGAISFIGEENKYVDENRLCLGTYFQ